MGRVFGGVLLFAFLALGTVASTAGPAGPRVSITRETRLALEARLDVLGGAAPLSERIALEGRPGRVLSLSRVLGPGDPYRVFLAFTPAPDEHRERCRVRVVSTVIRGGRTSVVDRVVNLAPERLGIVELWSTPDGRGRLVLGLTASWKDVPVVLPIVPGTEPVEFTIEAVSRTGEKEQLLEERRLTGLVGSPIRFTFERAAAVAAPPFTAESGGTLTLEITPENLHDGELELSARVTVEGRPGSVEPERDPGQNTVRRDALLHDRVPMGSPVELKLPLGSEGSELIFRITPYF